MPTVIRCLPSTRRDRTKSATWPASGADNGAVPRYVSLDGLPDDPPQQPHLYDQLRLRSVPTAVLPLLGCRFLRHHRYYPVAMSNSPPSGLRSGRIQISRVSTREVTRASVP
jgi:hypothetical protein